MRLEPHASKTQFKIGDPVIVDLIFTSSSPGYVVNTDPRTYLPTSDVAEIEPENGWVRTHRAYSGLGLNGNQLQDPGSNSIRVPVLLNRTITFLNPGHYEIRITNDRLFLRETMIGATPEGNCEACRTTNAIGIDLAERDEKEEAALAASLSKQLDQMKGTALDFALSHRPDESTMREIMALPPEEQVKTLNDLETAQLKLTKDWEDSRRNAAVQLAYLGGDEAMRAKVRFIAAGSNPGDASPIAPIMLDGLASSRNKQLQFSLVHAEWIDPKNLPSEVLFIALHQSRELTHSETVTDESIVFAGTPEDRAARVKEYENDLNELIPTLAQRTEPNHAATIDFLKKIAIPNQINGYK